MTAKPEPIRTRGRFSTGRWRDKFSVRPECRDECCICGGVSKDERKTFTAGGKLVRYSLACLSLLTLVQAHATSINVVGLFPGKAVVVIDGGAPRTMSAEMEVAGVKLISTNSDSATFLINGKREMLHIGQYSASNTDNGRASTTLIANSGGHYTTQGFINGGSITFLVDTGATLIVMSSADANRLGVKYKEGQLYMANTANGQVPFYRVKLDTVKVGDIVLNNVDAGVQENGLSITLLGMSFLSRTEMTRDGQNMVLTKRF